MKEWSRRLDQLVGEVEEQTKGLPLAVRLAVLTEAKRELDSATKHVRSLIADLEPLVEQAYLDEGTDSKTVTIPGGERRTVYTRLDRYAVAADGVEKQAINDALEEHGFGAVVNYNAGSLSAIVREMLEDGEAVAPWLAPLVEVRERVRIGVTSAGDKRTNRRPDRIGVLSEAGQGPAD